MAAKRKIYLSIKALDELCGIAEAEREGSPHGDKEMEPIIDELWGERSRLQNILDIRRELETGKGYYAKRPEEAEKILAGDKDCHFTQATFDWIIGEMEWHLIEWRNENLTTNNQH